MQAEALGGGGSGGRGWGLKDVRCFEEAGEELKLRSAQGRAYAINRRVSAQHKGAAFVIEGQLGELGGEDNVDAELLHTSKQPFSEALSTLIEAIGALEDESAEVLKGIGGGLRTEA